MTVLAAACLHACPGSLLAGTRVVCCTSEYLDSIELLGTCYILIFFVCCHSFLVWTNSVLAATCVVLSIRASCVDDNRSLGFDLSSTLV